MNRPILFNHLILAISKICTARNHSWRWIPFSFKTLLSLLGFWALANGIQGQTLTTNDFGPVIYCPGSLFFVNYTITGSFNPGNEFRVQLSDASGNFIDGNNSSNIIGSVTSTSAAQITAVLSNTQAAGTGYRVRVVSTNPVVNVTNASDDDNGNNITVPNRIITPTYPNPLGAYCVGSPISVPYTVNCNFIISNTFTLQLSDPVTGIPVTWTSPTTIATLNSTTSGTLTGNFPNVPAGNYAMRIVASNPAGVVSNQSGAMQINAVSVGGTVGNAQTICAGTAPANLTLSNQVGNEIKWQKSTDLNFTTFSDIASTSTTLTSATIGNLTADTYFRAVVKSGVCTEANSSPVLITVVSPTVTQPTVTQPTCVTPTGTIVVNATVTGGGTLEYSINNGGNWSTNPTFSDLAAGNYIIKVRTQGSPSCEATYGSNPVVLNPPFTMTAIDTWTGCVSTDWDTPGNWQDGSVPTATDDVNIPNVANDPIIGAGTAAVAKSVLVLGGAVLTINATGSLAINGSISPRHGLDNYGTLDNSGTIRVGNTTAVGAIGIVQRNGGTLNNKPNAAIYIDQTGSGQAFYTSGIVNNDATIEIGSNAAVTGQGLYIETPTGTFNNKANSLLTINRATTHGIENKGTLDNSGTIRIGNIATITAIGIVQRNGGTLNNKTGGAIYIDQTGSGQAFYTSGIVNNDATIEIGSNAAVTGQGLYIETPTGTFNNKANSLLTINRATTHGIENKGALDNSGTIRVGNIATITGIGILHRSGGTFNNKTNGAIYIDQTGSGQAFYSAGLVNNEASIKIGSNAAITGEGIRLEGNTFNNKTSGDIYIDQTSSAGIRLLNNGTVFNNESLIEIGSQSNVKGIGIRNESGCTFNNKVGGDIRINQIGILNISVTGAIRNSGTFTNDAKITVGNIGLVWAQDGILNFSGSFTNNATGIISIQKPWGNGIWNISGTFQNDGKITISNVFDSSDGTYSTGILSTTSFSNSSGAEIHLDQVGSGIITTNAFTNAGLIWMGENGALTGSGISNIQGVNAVFNNNAGGDISIKQTAVDGVQNDPNSTFNNNACAKLSIFDNLNNAGTFTNAGLFTVNTAQAHTNTGTLTNSGIIEYPQGNPIPNVTNNDVIVTPITICGTSSTPALQIGGMNNFTAGSIWYSDQTLTTQVGTYNQATNTFMLTNLALTGTQMLYLSINDDVNNCARVVSIKVTTNSLPTVGLPQNTLCTGQTLTLSPTTGGTWVSNAPAIASVSNAGLVTGLTPGMATFTFTETATGCSATTGAVTVKPTPISALSATKQDVCPNTEVSLNANCSEVGSTINWNPGGATVTPNAPDVAYTYKASCTFDGCTGNESSVEVRTHRILVDLKDVGLGAQPKAIAGAKKDNLAPTNAISAAISPRLWTILATGCSASESAVFKLTGPVNFSSIDNNPPYAIFANVGATYFAQDHPNYGNGSSTFPDGTYNLVVDLRAADGVGGPFPKNRIATGSLLATRSLQFTVSAGGARQGIEDLSLNSLEELNWASIFQNPVNEEIVVRLSGTVGEEVSLGLVNLQGQTVQSRAVKLSSPQQYEVLNVRQQNAGMYILKAIKADKVKTVKVIKAE